MNIIAEINGYKITRDYDAQDGTGMILVQEGSYTHKAYTFVDKEIPAEFRKPDATSEQLAVAKARQYIANVQ